MPFLGRQLDMFSFSGRLGRLAYFGHGIVAGLVMLVGTVMAITLSPNSEIEGMSPAGVVVLLIAFAVATWVALAAGAKRCHDLDKSGWFLLTTYIPLVGILFSLYILFAPGTLGQNRYSFEGGKSPHAGGMSPRELHISQFG